MDPGVVRIEGVVSAPEQVLRSHINSKCNTVFRVAVSFCRTSNGKCHVAISLTDSPDSRLRGAHTRSCMRTAGPRVHVCAHFATNLVEAPNQIGNRPETCSNCPEVVWGAVEQLACPYWQTGTRERQLSRPRSSMHVLVAMVVVRTYELVRVLVLRIQYSPLKGWPGGDAHPMV